jgi:hypothetical protein
MNLVKIRIAVVAGEDEENVRSTASVAAASGNAGRRTPSRATRDGLHRTVLVVLRVLGDVEGSVPGCAAATESVSSASRQPPNDAHCLEHKVDRLPLPLPQVPRPRTLVRHAVTGVPVREMKGRAGMAKTESQYRTRSS